ncbi:hybrid-cluster NAD(P)-dependent oxidoreductase [Streptomyces cylindrosporus]|uniref:Hybrid-cluster NAD(P)-dependent oxidoreductase n=1 Tax=Streptomyces cylindrosporus TaxID=2927583 RepID=A0ABS9Y1P3_9ACTN|nr:hybrid-cluster NAD(P)-dependent oxidoreductase [Streptomyces cylindrosporus]MCI3269866.1 hybrid-cluster NAD(P)-dependent oxidoreductase [Streptomyces cylindrosporus]
MTEIPMDWAEGDWTEGDYGGLLVCKQVHVLTPDVRTFVLQSPQPRLFRHDPGQFLTLGVDIDGRSVERCYTVSSPPTRPHSLTVTVKRVPGGLVSNWLHDHLLPGRTVRARGPLGDFSFTRHPAPKYLFLSGGSGATPMMAMTRTLYDLADPADVVFVHSARTPDDILFRRELDLIAATAPTIRVVHVCEEDGPTEPWGGHRGRLTLDMLRQIAPDFPQREIFTCGPAGYLAAVRDLLATAGFPMDRHHEESFTFERPQADDPPADPTDTAEDRSHPAEVPSYTVEFTRSRRTLTCDADTSLLAAASRAGLSLPASCAQGMCGTCKTTLLSGSVDMRHNGGIRPREIAQNKILLCCAKPREDLVVDA